MVSLSTFCPVKQRPMLIDYSSVAKSIVGAVSGMQWSLYGQGEIRQRNQQIMPVFPIIATLAWPLLFMNITIQVQEA
jgi:hypothetical protein